jgi:hypothetical protein
MKKLIVLLSVLIVAISADAQIKLGIKGGLNLNDMAFTKNTSLNDIAKNRTGWHFGMAMKVWLPFGLTLQPELLYSTKGATFNDEKLVLNYLEIPVALQWGINLGAVRPFVMVAPYVSYLIDSKSPIDNLKNWDGGIGIGFGADLWKLQVSFKYSWGLGSVSNVSVDNVSQETLKNRNIILSVGFFL